MSTRIAVVDTGICNLRSVTKALEAAEALPLVVRSPAELSAAEVSGLVLPGVGALRDCVGSLRASGMDGAVRDWIAQDRPFLGVCLGMQALFESSEEGDITGLGIFPGRVVRFASIPGRKIPHMGWNTIRFLQPSSPLAAGLSGAAPGMAQPSISSTATIAFRPIRAGSWPIASTAALLPPPSGAGGFSAPSSIRKRARQRDFRSTAISRRWPGRRKLLACSAGRD